MPGLDNYTSELMRSLALFAALTGKSRYPEALEYLIRAQKSGSSGELGKDADFTKLIKQLKSMLEAVRQRESALEEAVDRLDASHSELAALHAMLRKENSALKRQLKSRFNVGKIIGTSPKMAKVLFLAQRVADTSVNVLITGETGTGKEMVAKQVHYSGQRRHGPFIAINCTAVPDALFEAEFFGIEKGVATGVDKRKGLFEAAQGGTLFLDEIGDMPDTAQAKLLRVLESGEVTPVGARESVQVNVRLITATNRDLRKDIECGRFRSDLFYRIKVVTLDLPPLRERPDDIPLLAEYFLESYSRLMDRPKPRFSEAARQAMQSYSWPGNIRELENEVERAVALSYSEVIELEDLSRDVRLCGPEREQSEISLASPLENGKLKLLQLEAIKLCLKETGGNRSKAAKLLGISRESLRRKLKLNGLDLKPSA